MIAPPSAPQRRRASLSATCVALVLLLAAACSTRPSGSAPPLPILTHAQVVALVARLAPRATGREAWAQAVEDALRGNGIEANAPSTCAVLALVAQESGFSEDPAVPGLAKVVAGRLDRYQMKLGPLGGPVFRRLLAARAPANPRSFGERLASVRTERDLDLTFRDMLTYYESSHPRLMEAVSMAGKLFDGRALAELNPITTAGPMQVNVRFAEDWARAHHGDPARVRDTLYTRAGGVYYGTARLYAGGAPYPLMIHRFADYNAGFFSSRNAALQAQLAKLTGRKLVLDGDMLGYGPDGSVAVEDTQSMAALKAFRDRFAPSLSDRRLLADAREEKTLGFEETESFRAVKSAYAAKINQPPAYAILPEITLVSPKLARPRSTAWFAEAVNTRYEACLSSAR